MKRMRTKLGLFLLLAAMASACDECDATLAPDHVGGDDDDAVFNVAVMNIGSTAFRVTTPYELVKVVQPGDTYNDMSGLSGSDDSQFTFRFADTAGASLGSVTCTLRNQKVALVFARTVKFDAASKIGHCVNWGP